MSESHRPSHLVALASSATSGSSSGQSSIQSPCTTFDDDEIEVLREELFASNVPQPSNGTAHLPVDSQPHLVPAIEPKDVQWAFVDHRHKADTLQDVRRSLVTQFPVLAEPAASTSSKTKTKSPSLAPPPALLPKPKVISQAERTNRTASLAVRLEHMEERAVVKGLIALEKRSYTWLPIEDTNVQSNATHPASTQGLPSPWLAPIDSSHLLKDTSRRPTSKLYSLPQHRMVQNCKACSGSGATCCSRCQGIETQECFGCSGTKVNTKGKPCQVCRATGVYQCMPCTNSGQIECTACKGNGSRAVGLFVKVTMRFVSLDPIRVESLAHPGLHVSQSNFDATVRQAATAKILASVNKLQANRHQEDAFFPVMARCVLERSIARTYSVLRPLCSNPKEYVASHGDATPSGVTGEETAAHSESSSALALVPGFNPVFSFEGLHPRTPVERHLYRLSSIPNSAAKEVSQLGGTSTPYSGSRNGSTSGCQTPLDSMPATPSDPFTPFGAAALSPRTSVANLQALARQCETRQSFLSIPGTPFHASHNGPLQGSAANQRAVQEDNAAQLVEALRKVQLQSLERMPASFRSSRPSLLASRRGSKGSSSSRSNSSFNIFRRSRSMGQMAPQ